MSENQTTVKHSFAQLYLQITDFTFFIMWYVRYINTFTITITIVLRTIVARLALSTPIESPFDL